jgi:hypothetical protein
MNMPIFKNTLTHYLFFVAFLFCSALSYNAETPLHACNVGERLPWPEIKYGELKRKRLAICSLQETTKEERDAAMAALCEKEQANYVIAMVDALQNYIPKTPDQPHAGIKIAYCFYTYRNTKTGDQDYFGSWHLLFSSECPLIVEGKQYNSMQLSGLQTRDLLRERNARIAPRLLQRELQRENFNTPLKDIFDDINLLSMLYVFYSENGRQNLFSFNKEDCPNSKDSCLCNTDKHYLGRRRPRVELFGSNDVERIRSKPSHCTAYDWILLDATSIPEQTAHNPAEESLFEVAYWEGQKASDNKEAYMERESYIPSAVYGPEDLDNLLLVSDGKEESSDEEAAAATAGSQENSPKQSLDNVHDNEPADVAKKTWTCCRML